MLLEDPPLLDGPLPAPALPTLAKAGWPQKLAELGMEAGPMLPGVMSTEKVLRSVVPCALVLPSLTGTWNFSAPAYGQCRTSPNLLASAMELLMRCLKCKF